MNWWILCFGLIGGIGVLLATEHYGHHLGHWAEMITVQVLAYALGLAVVYWLIVPVLQQRTSLTSSEVAVYLVGGTIGMIFLAHEAEHLLHGNRIVGWAIGLITICVVALLWIYRPTVNMPEVSVPRVGAAGQPSFWWMTFLGFPGSIGILLAAYHYGHVWGHALHARWPMILVWALGIGAIVGMGEPLLHQRTALSGPELWLFLTGGSFGVLFLLAELGHWLCRHQRLASVVTLVGLALLVTTWVTRPVGVAFSRLPTTASAHAVPPRGPIAGQSFGTLAPGSSPSVTAPPKASKPAAKSAYNGPPVPREKLPEMFRE